jgi:hypothetical protein
MNIFINISGVYDEEEFRIPEGHTLDLKGLGGSCCYCSSEAGQAIRKAISPYPVSGIHWIDTGDYHYISKLWMEKIREPFALVLFDNHTDDQDSAFGGMLSCGNWVKAARESLPMMKADYLNTADIPDGLPVYLSIDLDVLSSQYARTDWDQGDMTLDGLLGCLERISASHRILGTDICGGLTPGKGAKAEDLAVNARTRKVLNDYISKG